MDRATWLRIVAMITERVESYPDSNSYREACGYVRGYGLDTAAKLQLKGETKA